VADRWLTVIEDLPEKHTPNRALPQWAIDSLLFGTPRYTSAPKIWGRMVSIAMSAQARGWTQMELRSPRTSAARTASARSAARSTSSGPRWSPTAITRSRIWTRPGSRPMENRMNEGFRTADDLIADAVERAYRWEDRLTEGKDGLPDSEALVLSWIALVLSWIGRRSHSI
jgi:hypothetical protein